MIGMLSFTGLVAVPVSQVAQAQESPPTSACTAVIANSTFENPSGMEFDARKVFVDSGSLLAPWWVLPTNTAVPFWSRVGPTVAAARTGLSPGGVDFGPAISGNLFVKDTPIVSDSWQSAYPNGNEGFFAGPGFVANKFFASGGGRRFRLTFFARLVTPSPATFSYVFSARTSTPERISLSGLSTSTWKKFTSYSGGNYSRGFFEVSQDLTFDPQTAEIVLPSARGSIAISDVSIEECGGFNPACTVDSVNGATVCGVTYEQPQPGYGFIENIDSQTYLTRPADRGGRVLLSGDNSPDQQWIFDVPENRKTGLLRELNGQCLVTDPIPPGYTNLGGTPLLSDYCDSDMNESRKQFYFSDLVNVDRAAGGLQSRGVYRLRNTAYTRDLAGGDSKQTIACPGVIKEAVPFATETVLFETCDLPTSRRRIEQAWRFTGGSGFRKPSTGLGDYVFNYRDLNHSAIGKLTFYAVDESRRPVETGWCSATFVAEKELDQGAVVTARHCFPGSNLAVFTPAYNRYEDTDAKQNPYGFFISGVGDWFRPLVPNDYVKDDFAFIRISRQFKGSLADALASVPQDLSNLSNTGTGLRLRQVLPKAPKIRFAPSAAAKAFAYGYPTSTGWFGALVVTKDDQPAVTGREIVTESGMGVGSSGGPVFFGDVFVGVRSKARGRDFDGLDGSYSRVVSEWRPFYVSAGGATQ